MAQWRQPAYPVAPQHELAGPSPPDSENEGIRRAIIVAVTGPPISSSRNSIAPRTKSIFHWGKIGLRGALMLPRQDRARVDGLKPTNAQNQQRNLAEPPRGDGFDTGQGVACE